MTNVSLMKVESIAECSPWNILQYFRSALSDTRAWRPLLCLFESGRFRQVLLCLLLQDLEDEDIELTADSYVVVYSITDKNSFDTAVQFLYTLRHCMDSDRPIVLVGNKADLVRKRKVKKEGKYIFK